MKRGEGNNPFRGASTPPGLSKAEEELALTLSKLNFMMQQPLKPTISLFYSWGEKDHQDPVTGDFKYSKWAKASPMLNDPLKWCLSSSVLDNDFDLTLDEIKKRALDYSNKLGIRYKVQQRFEETHKAPPPPPFPVIKPANNQ